MCAVLFNLNWVQPRPSLSPPSSLSERSEEFALSPSFCSSPVTPSTISRLPAFPYFQLKGRDDLRGKGKEAEQPYMQLPPLFPILSAGHSSVHHQWQPWINSLAASVQASRTCLVGNIKGWRTGRGLFRAGSLQAPTPQVALEQWTWPSLLRLLSQLCLTSTAAGS